MTLPTLVEQVLAIPGTDARKRFLREHAHALDSGIAGALKDEAGRLLRADVQRSLDVVDLIYQVAELTGDPTDRALGLLAEANARSIGLAEYEQAIRLYDQAAELYRRQDLVVEVAKAQVGKVGALPHLGRYHQALAIGQWAGPILAEREAWLPLATLTMNLAAMQARRGEDGLALELFDEAADSYAQLGKQGRAGWLWVQLNRAFVLRNLGRFEASIQASETARDGLTALGQTVAAARAGQNLALTYFILGRYNEALEQLDRARAVFLADGRQRDAMLVELFISDCLLQLHRLNDVVEKCREVRKLFTSIGSLDVVAQALVKQAAALAGLGRHDDAIQALHEARHIFAESGNQAWTAQTDLEIATVLHLRGRPQEALTTALTAAGVFKVHDLVVEEAQAFLIAAQAALELAQGSRAQELSHHALELAERLGLASLAFRAHHLLGRVAVSQGRPQAGLAAFERAIAQLERLRGQLMVEFRADFLADKAVLYEDAVLLGLELGLTEQSLDLAERAKSRALLDLLAYRLDLGLEAKTLQDQPLVAELVRLRSERDQLFRRWQGREGLGDSGKDRHRVEQEVLTLENQITDLWHRLLIRNAEYASEAALWQVHTEPIRPHLKPGTALVEYFYAKGRFLAFVATESSVVCRVLAATPNQIQHSARLLRLNLNAAPRSSQVQLSGLIGNAQALLQQLHEQLWAPLTDCIPPGWPLVIVPHGPLHYLPFHAFFDGEAYLLQRHEISYLPGASLLRYCDAPRETSRGLVTIGHSFGGKLPHTLDEARAIASIFGGQLYLEEEATTAQLAAAAAGCRILHLAAHGSFRPDNPLFSGLAMAGSWLTTLDIFNLRLRAALVTLSACETGRSAIGGGDELLGLMRAFLYAGAASLVLSLWTVEDRSTALLMENFYRRLAAGERKSVALRQAQLGLVGADRRLSDEERTAYGHPYFWAPFYLVGNCDAL